MSTEPENFDALRKLLALKRHEQPPPGFFRDLPGKVMIRIEREDAAAVGWWVRLREAFELRPALSVGFAGALCGLLMAGVYFGNRTEPGAEPGLAVTAPSRDDAAARNPFNVTTGDFSRPPEGIFEPKVGVQRVEFRTNATVRP
jgi:hypothetical protein